jgi:hypothetical protein
MNRNEILETFIGTFVVCLIAGGIVWLGWNEPLSYRFMSQEDIAERELTLHPPPPRRATMQEWSAQGTALDRAPYTRGKLGKIRYSDHYGFDNREVGIPTESGSRSKTLNPQPQ